MKDDTAAYILIADDQPDVLEALRMLLKNEGYRIDTATSPSGILQALQTADYDVVLMDLNYARDTTSGKEGLDLLKQIQILDSMLPVIVMTAWGSVELAVEAMQHGARDFVQKPWDNTRLLTILRTQLELGRALRKGERLEAEARLLREQERPRMIASSAVMQPVLDLISRIGPSDANVLIMGEHDGEGSRGSHASPSRFAAPSRLLSSTPAGCPRVYSKRAFRPRERFVHRRPERPRRQV